MTRKKTNQRIVIEEILKHDRKANVYQICTMYFGYSSKKVSDIIGNMKRC